MFRRALATTVALTAVLALSSCGETVNIGGDAVGDGITVRATGTADVVPDAVRLSLSVSVVAQTPEDATARVASSADAVREALFDSGVEEGDIATQGYSVAPEYDYSREGGPVITGHRATQMFDVLIRDAESAGAVIDAVVAAGGSDVSVNGTTPIVDDATDAAVAAREDAVKKAREKAEEYAKLLGVSLGDIIAFSEIDAPVNVAPVMRTEAAADAATTIDLGTSEVSVSVEVRWSID